MSEETPPNTDGKKQMTIHNVNPDFKSKEAQEKRKQEITQTLYRIFSKYI